MRTRIIQFGLKMVVAIGIALLGVNAIGGLVASSAVERWVTGQETLAKSFRSPGPSEFRLSEQQQLRKIFVFKKPF